MTTRVSTQMLNFTSGNVVLSNIANLRISGGSNGQAIVTDGSGNLSFGNVSLAAGGSNTSSAKVVGYNLVFGG